MIYSDSFRFSFILSETYANISSPISFIGRITPFRVQATVCQFLEEAAKRAAS